MKRYHFFVFIKILVAICVCSQAFAKELGKEEVKTLHADIAAMYTAFENGNAQLFLDKAHSSIYAFVGGEENYEKAMKDVVSGLMNQGIKFIGADLGQPSKLYRFGGEELSFVPRISTMELRGQKVRSTGFLIAIRKAGSSSWSYLDGSGLRKDTSLLWKLLPELTKDVVLPPNYVEML